MTRRERLLLFAIFSFAAAMVTLASCYVLEGAAWS